MSRVIVYIDGDKLVFGNLLPRYWVRDLMANYLIKNGNSCIKTMAAKLDLTPGQINYHSRLLTRWDYAKKSFKRDCNGHPHLHLKLTPNGSQYFQFFLQNQ